MRKLLFFLAAFSILVSAYGICVLFPQLYSQDSLTEALFYEKKDNNSVQCLLCPRMCTIPEGRRGFCGVRENRDGTLYALTYGKLVAVHVDPIEKKPLFHFLPGTDAFSIATAGCNLRCKFCQNWQISQRKPEELSFDFFEPAQLVEQALSSGAPTIAYTYTEPTIFYEYMLAVARLAKKAGLKNIMHSSGYIQEEPLRHLVPYLDAANIDLKGFTQEYYADLSEGTLEPVLKTLKILKDSGVHLEITNLILPGYNDNDQTLTRMCLWIKENLGVDTPLHFSRFYPMYKLANLNPTPVLTLERAQRIALECGLKYVYIGNVAGHSAENTYCWRCGKTLIARRGYFIVENNIEHGTCRFCHASIEGVWR